MDYFHGRATSLKEAFPEPFITHALAVKANSMRGVLLEAKNLGLGGECASLQEAKHCLSLGNYPYNIIAKNNNLKYKGFAPEKVIYDSPVKTPLEVKEAIDLGFHMNLDNEREVFVILLTY